MTTDGHRADANGDAVIGDPVAADAPRALLGREELTSCFVHEIANPIAYVLCNLEYMDQHRTSSPGWDSELSHSLDDALAGARYVVSLVHDFRDLACGRRPKLAPIPLSPAIDTALGHVGAALSVSPVFEVTGAADLWLCGHRVLFVQALANVLTNALQAQGAIGRADEPVRIQAQRHDERIRISVIDRGSGIPDELRGCLFDARSTTKTTGLGLGLHLSRRLARLMDGELSLESTSVDGACFTFDFPAA